MSVMPAAAVCAATLGLVAGGLWYASAWPESQLFGPTLIASDDPLEVALTFDDGPNDSATPELLGVLSRYNVRATFFVIGIYARERPDLVRAVRNAGHLVGNHTMHHPRLSIQPASRIRQELADCNALLEDITGSAVRFFRPPFGARRPLVLRAAHELGLIPVMWNVSGYDWRTIGSAGILHKLQTGIARNRGQACGSNLLLHDGSHLAMGASRRDTVTAVDQLLAVHDGSSTRLVTVDRWQAEAS